MTATPGAEDVGRPQPRPSVAPGGDPDSPHSPQRWPPATARQKPGHWHVQRTPTEVSPLGQGEEMWSAFGGT